jgi:hypothetical protein
MRISRFGLPSAPPTTLRNITSRKPRRRLGSQWAAIQERIGLNSGWLPWRAADRAGGAARAHRPVTPSPITLPLLDECSRAAAGARRANKRRRNALLHHLIGPREQGRWNVDAERS